MKRCLILVVTAFMLVACRPSEGLDLGHEEQIIENLLYDFDFLMTFIEENSPLIGPIERRVGIDFNVEMLRIRDRITVNNIHFGRARTFEEMEEAAAQFFFDHILMEIMVVTRGLGHLSPTSEESLIDHFARVQRYLLESEERSMLGYLFYEQYQNPVLARFYNLDDVCLETDGFGDYNKDNITTEILVPGEIAYVSVDSFMNSIEMDGDVLRPFFEEIQDFDHLIIDIRGNFGGYMNHFTHLFMATLLDDHQVVSYPEFFRRTDTVLEHVEAYMDSQRVHSGFDGTFRSADDFFRENPMPHMNPNDRALLDYVVEWEYVIEPSEDNIPFDGEIWLLVDHWSASASENAAIYSMSSGFATVVGYETIGVLGAMTLSTPLPNTGILFRVDFGFIPDAYGWSQEEFGVAPEYLVPRGSDILDYVLDMIMREG